MGPLPSPQTSLQLRIKSSVHYGPRPYVSCLRPPPSLTSLTPPLAPLPLAYSTPATVTSLLFFSNEPSPFPQWGTPGILLPPLCETQTLSAQHPLLSTRGLSDHPIQVPSSPPPSHSLHDLSAGHLPGKHSTCYSLTLLASCPTLDCQPHAEQGPCWPWSLPRTVPNT